MKILEAKSLLQNRYLIEHLIGKGGMGEVYLAVDKRLGHKVALKRTFFTDDEILAAAFEREARTLASLRHPVLPKVSDHFTENGEQYLIMEFIDGEDLSKRIELSKKAFPINWVLFWADELLEALAYLHTQKPAIIHRDIKPQNLKLTNDNHIILLDFGLAKNNAGQALNSTGSVVGYTPHYAPMEQIRGLGTTPQSDIYSLSATLYQLLTNIVPPDALKRADDIVNGKADSIEVLNKLNPSISAPISDVILKGLSLRATERFVDAREMQKALREAYAGVQEVQAANAKTVGFNVVSEIPLSQKQTESFVSQSYLPNTVADVKIEALITAENISIPAQDLGATIRIENFNAPIGEKTEVMNLIGDKTEVMHSVGEKTEVLPNFSVSESVAPVFVEENINATMPNISFNNQENFAPTEVSHISQSEGQQAVFFQSADSITPNSVVEHNSVATQTQPQAKKKSAGFAVAVLGVIGLVGLIVIGGGIGGWYYLNETGNAVITDPTPSVKPSVEETITPAPTQEVTTIDNNNSNIGNSNSDSNTNSLPSNTSTIVETNPTVDDDKPTDKPVIKSADKPVVTNDKPVLTTPPNKVAPPKQTQQVVTTKQPVTPKVIKTPKTKPTQGGRTDILQ